MAVLFPMGNGISDSPVHIIQLYVFDSNGNLIISINDNVAQYDLDISNLNRGIYFIAVTASKVYQEKFVVEK